MTSGQQPAWSGALGLLLLLAARSGAVLLQKVFPWLAGWAFFTHGVVAFALSFVAPSVLGVRMWQRWVLLATVSAGTLVELIGLHGDTPPSQFSIALLLACATIAAFMAVDGWKMQQSQDHEGESAWS